MTISICIFAHNEEELLPACIAALESAAAGHTYHAHILANGCADQTVAVANSLAAANPNISVYDIVLGDKASAWNDYVYHIAAAAEPADAHIFIDGDIRPSEGAFKALATTLATNPEAYGAAALPATGRSQKAWATKLIMEHQLSGNLYALSDRALTTLRSQKIRLPVGAKGEDGLIAYLLLTDLKGGEDDSHTKRIEPAYEATFEFDSLTLRWRDFKILHRRALRYAERRFQKEILYRRLKRDGVAAMPAFIDEIYTPDELETVKLRRDPYFNFYDRTIRSKLRLRNANPFRRPRTKAS